MCHARLKIKGGDFCLQCGQAGTFSDLPYSESYWGERERFLNPWGLRPTPTGVPSSTPRYDEPAHHEPPPAVGNETSPDAFLDPAMRSPQRSRSMPPPQRTISPTPSDSRPSHVQALRQYPPNGFWSSPYSQSLRSAPSSTYVDPTRRYDQLPSYV